ncbi:GTPase activating protein [Madurella fahalii]|uniref:GTPase activating protein n=1 Tax=Madurella fahalii TaxID=1157608 RepID=A0ABQ0GB51_9PEZI
MSDLLARGCLQTSLNDLVATPTTPATTDSLLSGHASRPYNYKHCTSEAIDEPGNRRPRSPVQSARMTRITKMTSSSSNLPPSQQTTTTTSSLSSQSHPPRPASPAGSLYAMSDDEEGDYDTITHTETGRGVKLLFSKSKVYIHPTPSAKDNIAGYIALLQQKNPSRSGADRPSSSSSSASRSPASSDLLLAWVPESQLGDAASIYVKVDLCDGDSPPKQSYLVPPPPTVTSHRGSLGQYAFAIPVSAVYSLLVRPPSVGWWYGSVIINSRAGDSFPALFFHDNECQSTMLQKKRRARDRFDPFGEGGEMFWGGDEVLRWLRRYVVVERSMAEPNVYLVEPSKEDSEAFGGKVTGGGATAAAGGRDRSSGGSWGVAGPSRGAGGGSSEDGGMDPFMKFVKETGWNIMEKFSKVTTFTRQAAQDVLDNPRMPPQVRRLLRNPEVQTLQEEFDSARIYLARWAMGIAEQSERDRNQRIWTAREVMELEDTDVGEFELLDSTSSLTLEQIRRPVTLKEWKSFFDPRSGRLAVTVDEVKERVFHGGLDPDDGVRKEAWLFLLGVHEWYSTSDERKAQAASLRDAYIKLKGAWWERQIDKGGEGEEGEWWREQRARIEKDVHRTDRNVPIFAGEDIPHPDPDSPFAGVGTNLHMEQLKEMLLTYNEFNRDLGYVQGMSDLLAPIYAVFQDDAMAFWGFKSFMERMERNFLRDQSGMRSQLRTLDHLVQFMDPKLYAHLESADSTNFFFFFRMLLVWYKREFGWMDVLHLWEVLWTDYLSSNFHLFVALAILEKHRDVIMAHLKHFDEVLKYVNELSCTIDLDSTLIRAEALFKRFQRLVDAVDKKGNFPAPRLRLSQGPGSSSSVTPAAAAVPAAASSTSPSRGVDNGKAPARPEQRQELEKVISPELRRLLSRQVEVLPRKEVAKKGDGLAGTRGK